jgi:internalin A
LYCEQPGAFHVLAEDPYIITRAADWLKTISPYLVILIAILRHAAPVVGPVLGLSSDQLAQRFAQQTDLMTQLVSELPDVVLPAEDSSSRLSAAEASQYANLDVDYRVLHSLLHDLDPSEHWAGLSRVYTPEDQILWLCRDHARQYARR